MSNRPVMKRLPVGYPCVAIAAVTLVAVYGSYVAQSLYSREVEDDLEVRARLCGRQIIELVERNEPEAVDALCKELGNAVDTRITVIRPTGEVVGDTEKDPSAMENHADRPEVKQALESRDAVGHTTRHSTTLDATLMYVAVALPDSDAPAVVVRTSIPILTVTQKLAAINRRILAVGVVAVLVIVAVVPWFSIRLTSVETEKKRKHRPLEDDEDLMPPVPEKQPTEPTLG